MYNYHEVIDYIEKKYNIKTRDYAGKFGKDGNTNNEYQDFWHWVLQGNEYITNGSSGIIYVNELSKNISNWIKEILQLIKDEGFVDDEDYFTFWIKW